MALPNLPLPSPDTALQLAPGDLLKAGWDFIKPHILVVDAVIIGSMILNIALGRIPIIGAILSLVINIFIHPGLLYYLWRAKVGETPSVGDLLVPMQDKAGGIFIVWLAVVAAIIVGCILLIIPGLYLGIALSLALPLVTLTSASVSDALGLSWKIVNKHLGDFIVLTLLIIVLNIGGAILLGIGLFLTLPLTIGIFMVVLGQLLQSTNAATSETLAR